MEKPINNIVAWTLSEGAWIWAWAGDVGSETTGCLSSGCSRSCLLERLLNNKLTTEYLLRA